MSETQNITALLLNLEDSMGGHSHCQSGLQTAGLYHASVTQHRSHISVLAFTGYATTASTIECWGERRDNPFQIESGACEQRLVF
jgi:hypothetical protein